MISVAAFTAFAAFAVAGCGSANGPSGGSPSAHGTGTARPTGTSTSTSPGASSSEATMSTATTTAPQPFAITSPDFAADGPIPQRFTCDGANVSPELRWTGVPARAAALALVVDDPDAPSGTFTHWVVVDIAPTVTGSAQGQPPQGARQVTNDTGKTSYFGPCPPSGVHHYRFTLYSLRAPVGPASSGSLASALAAIRASATAQSRVVGTYHR